MSGWQGTAGSGGLVIDGTVAIAAPDVDTNFLVGSGAHPGSGQLVIALANVVTAPVSLAVLHGGVLYAQSGHLFYLGQLGTITQVGSA